MGSEAPYRDPSDVEVNANEQHYEVLHCRNQTLHTAAAPMVHFVVQCHPASTHQKVTPSSYWMDRGVVFRLYDDLFSFP